MMSGGDFKGATPYWNTADGDESDCDTHSADPGLEHGGSDRRGRQEKEDHRKVGGRGGGPEWPARSRRHGGQAAPGGPYQSKANAQRGDERPEEDWEPQITPGQPDYVPVVEPHFKCLFGMTKKARKQYRHMLLQRHRWEEHIKRLQAMEETQAEEHPMDDAEIDQPRHHPARAEGYATLPKAKALHPESPADHLKMPSVQGEHCRAAIMGPVAQGIVRWPGNPIRPRNRTYADEWNYQHNQAQAAIWPRFHEAGSLPPEEACLPRSFPRRCTFT